MSVNPARSGVAIDAGGYTVHVGAGLGDDLAPLIAEAAPAHHYAVISDGNISSRYGDPLAASLSRFGRTSSHVIPPGESFKTRETWSRLTDELLDAGGTRDTTVVALGGGVVGDLAGFVAATYMRGVPVVQVPTTLLAMIDASVGGKTGVDTEAGKNLVGAFHAPAAVVADVDVLSTLPLAHRRAGLAEAIKHGVIADADYLTSIESQLDALLRAEPAATLPLVARSVELKADVARADPLEHGRRRILNFGHTLGHAIEHVSGFSLLHGECVAIGMVLEARLAERLGIAARGIAERIEHTLAAAGLPTSRPEHMDVNAIIASTRRDKKARAGAVEYALPTRIGEMAEQGGRWSVPVEEDVVREVLA